MKSISVRDILFELTNDKRVYEDVDLIEEKIMDSITYIGLFSYLEDLGVTLYPTRLDKNVLRRVNLLQGEVDRYVSNKEK